MYRIVSHVQNSVTMYKSVTMYRGIIMYRHVTIYSSIHTHAHIVMKCRTVHVQSLPLVVLVCTCMYISATDSL